MPRILAAVFTSSFQPCWWVATIVVAGALTPAPWVESLGVALTDASHSREADRTADDDERRLLADLERVQLRGDRRFESSAIRPRHGRGISCARIGSRPGRRQGGGSEAGR